MSYLNLTKEWCQHATCFMGFFLFPFNILASFCVLNISAANTNDFFKKILSFTHLLHEKAVKF